MESPKTPRALQKQMGLVSGDICWGFFPLLSLLRNDKSFSSLCLVHFISLEDFQLMKETHG